MPEPLSSLRAEGEAIQTWVRATPGLLRCARNDGEGKEYTHDRLTNVTPYTTIGLSDKVGVDVKALRGATKPTNRDGAGTALWRNRRWRRPARKEQTS